MAQWQNKLDLTDIWDSVDEGKMTIQELSAEVAKRLKALSLTDIDDDLKDERDEIVDEFIGVAEDDCADLQDFNNVMFSLYEWADTPLDNKFNGKKICWVATFF